MNLSESVQKIRPDSGLVRFDIQAFVMQNETVRFSGQGSGGTDRTSCSASQQSPTVQNVHLF